MIVPGVTGSLLSHEVLLRDFATAPRGTDRAEAIRTRLHARQSRALAELGPATGARAVFDRVAAPLAGDLGFAIVSSAGDGVAWRSVLAAGPTPVAALLTTAWQFDGAAAWRGAVRHAIGAGVRWCLCVNGPGLRIFDGHRTYSRRHAEFDLLSVFADAGSFAIAWNLLSAAAFRSAGAPSLDRAVARSEQHRTLVRTALQGGVEEALTRLVQAFAVAAGPKRSGSAGAGSTGPERAGPQVSSVRGDVAQAAFDEALIVVYRVLFLLFAEARGLVPRWHPTFRESYTIEALQPAVERLTRPTGIWESLQAIARLAHRGCRAGSLRVPPFNGRLFSPVHAPLADSVPLDDEAVRQALAALTTRKGAAGPARIAYSELGVEQLGGVYERVLDYEPASPARGPIGLGPSLRRKATGTFYTPRSLTEYVVRRTLAPLLRDASSGRILSLRIVDPAMGSGAFLVAACRYLATAYEAALVREGAISSCDVTAADRAGFRRTIAQRCLYGVDANPMAVQLARLSLWLATLSGDRPLTFLDHHLRAGNSLVGASLPDVARPPRPKRSGSRAEPALPLFDWDAADAAIRATVGPRLSLAVDPGDTLDEVRAKERLLASLSDDSAPLAAWRTVADLWCSPWFVEPGEARVLRRAFGALVDGALGRESALPRHVARRLLETSRDIAGREGFFHWTLEFPEVFVRPSGTSMAAAGFDAVLCNPPWETLRGDAGDMEARRTASERSGRLTLFARASGVYRLHGEGHANLYQLFVERALSLVRTGGRVGLVLPSGFATDHGCASLRRHLLDRTTVDTFVVVENKDALFPIHRSLKFLLLAVTAEPSTAAIPQRCGVRSPDALDRLPDEGIDPSAVVVERSLLVRMSGDQLAIQEFRDRRDVEIAAKLAYSVPALGDPAGWNVRFGRELNASDDRTHFVERDAGRALRGVMSVVEGKHVRPFTVDLGATTSVIAVKAARRVLDAARTYRRPRLAYRDVSCATNRVTLIAAIIPRGAVTTHTLFCLKDDLDPEAQHFLCGVFNSYVANYLVRLRVGTHVSASIIHALPVPKPAPTAAAFARVAFLARWLERTNAGPERAGPRTVPAGLRTMPAGLRTMPAGLRTVPAGLRTVPAGPRTVPAGPEKAGPHSELQARVASLYGLTAREFEHVLSTFPLVDADERRNALRAFTALTV